MGGSDIRYVQRLPQSISTTDILRSYRHGLRWGIAAGLCKTPRIFLYADLLSAASFAINCSDSHSPAP
jgi:hypothetical protein